MQWTIGNTELYYLAVCHGKIPYLNEGAIAHNGKALTSDQRRASKLPLWLTSDIGAAMTRVAENKTKSKLAIRKLWRAPSTQEVKLNELGNVA